MCPAGIGTQDQSIAAAVDDLPASAPPNCPPSLCRGCRRHGINPYDYLKDLFTRLLAAKITAIRQFTPAAWIRANTKEKLLTQAA